MVVTHAIESVFYSSFLHRIRTPYFMLRTVTSASSIRFKATTGPHRNALAIAHI